MRMPRLSAVVLLSSAVLLGSCSNDATGPDGGSSLQFVIVSGNNQVGVAGEQLSQPIQVRVLDGKQQPVPNLVVYFFASAGGGSVTAGATITDPSGLTADNWRLGQVAGAKQTLEIRADDAKGVRRVYGTVSAAAIAGPLTTSAAFAGAAQSAPMNTAVPIAPAVKLTDQYGNGVSNQAVTFAVTSGGGSITGGTATTDGTGVARVGSWTLGSISGPNTLTATAAALPGSPMVFTATGTGGPTLSFKTTASTTAQSGIALVQQPAIQLLDGQGAPLPQQGVQVTAVLIGSNGTLTGTTTVATDASGVATFTDLVITGQVGSYSVRFDVTGYYPLTSNSIILAAGPVAVFAKNQGDGQVLNAGTAVPTLPEVLVTDSWGNPITGLSITFTLTSGGGSVTGAVQLTNASGIARVGNWKLGPLSGPNSLTASVTAGGQNTTFNATALGNFWSSRALMPTGRRYPSGAVINGRFYVAGGRDNNNTTRRELEAYNPATNTWTTRAQAPTARSGAVAGVINGIMYVVGGEDSGGQTLATLEAYDPSTDTWSTKAPLPAPRTYGAVGVINNILYYAGGGGGGPWPELFAYDPLTNAWTQKASLPMGRVDISGVAANGLFYVVGGTTTTTVDGGVYAYDPQTDSWTQKASMGVPRFHLTTEALGGRLHAVGGFAIGGAISAVVEAYDPGTNTWAALASLPVGRVTPALGAISGLLYSAGGQSPTATIRDTDAYVP